MLISQQERAYLADLSSRWLTALVDAKAVTDPETKRVYIEDLEQIFNEAMELKENYPTEPVIHFVTSRSVEGHLCLCKSGGLPRISVM